MPEPQDTKAGSALADTVLLLPTLCAGAALANIGAVVAAGAIRSKVAKTSGSVACVQLARIIGFADYNCTQVCRTPQQEGGQRHMTAKRQ